MLSKPRLKTWVHVALLTAVEVVLSRFLSIPTPITKIGLGFAPVAVCAMLYGPGWAAACAALADITGALLFPIGAFFPGFTLSAACTGAVYGCFLHLRPAAWPPNIVLAAAVNSIAVSLGLTTLWLSLTTGSPFGALLPVRAIQAAVMLPVQVLVIGLLAKPVALYARRLRA